MKEIKLTQGKVALVDDEDYEYLSQWKWCYHRDRNLEYAARGGDNKLLLMHRIILDVPKGMFTDHINHNGIDNRKSNLRICTLSQNQANSRLYKNNKSGYRGISWNEECHKWRVVIRCHNKRIHLGLFENINDAIAKYKNAAIELFGEFANI